jgi:hypothetical protein
MRIKPFAYLLLVVFSLGTALGQSKAPPKSSKTTPGPIKDIDGWGKIKWGMTTAQARAAYGSEATIPEGENPYKDTYIEKLIIKSLTVGDVEMKVSIAALNKTDRIANIALENAGSLTDSVSAGAYSNLKIALTRKYGTPASTDHTAQSRVTSDVTKWIFPSTAIELLEIEIESINYGSIHLTYSAANKKLLDVL